MTMTFQEYTAYFQGILERAESEQVAPYDAPGYMEYTKLNWSRMKRWLKMGELSDGLLRTVARIDTPQNWIAITEPWCGDAAHNIPFIEMVARENPLITLTYQLRDSEPFLIDQYLTNGTKSIPKLVIRNADGKDLGTWGPRPANCQEIYTRLTAERADFETVNIAIQKWYNANKGVDVQRELNELLEQTL